jgi:HEAT repeat protein
VANQPVDPVTLITTRTTLSSCRIHEEPMRRFVPSVAFILSLAVLWLAPTRAELIIDPQQHEKLFDLPQRPRAVTASVIELLRTACLGPDDALQLDALRDIAELQIDQLTLTVSELLDDDQPSVRLAAACTLAALDDAFFAPALFESLQRIVAVDVDAEALSAALVVDEALARWRHLPAIKHWRHRMLDPSMPIDLRISATNALAVVGPDASMARQELVGLATGDGHPHLRLVAARALASVAEGTSTIDIARTLLADEMMFARLLAANVLAADRSAEANHLLIDIAQRDEPVTQRIALSLLLNRDASLIQPIGQTLLESEDPPVRQLAVRALAEWKQTDSVALLARMLDDRHPAVRTAARDAILQLAEVNQNLAGAAAEAAMEILATARDQDHTTRLTGWRDDEQAAFIIAALDHEPAADALMALLMQHARTDVKLAAIMALRHLDVPHTRTAVLEYFRQVVGEIRPPAASSSDPDAEAAKLETAGRIAHQLALTLGQWREGAADNELRTMVGKKFAADTRIRAAAVWALGRIHQNADHQQNLVDLLAGRLADFMTMVPEANDVRAACAVALGRIGDDAALSTLRQYHQHPTDRLDVRAACGWAIGQITGQDPPPLQPATTFLSPRFIQPLD